MQIISHRGCWNDTAKKNTEKAFRRALNLNYGIETDVRDYNGEIVISHDIAKDSCLTFLRFCEIVNEANNNPCIALNIKSDGLQEKLKHILNNLDIRNYFVFDMSVPDAYLYINEKFNVFARQSEFEQNPSFYEASQGIWLDAFHNEWYDEHVIEKHLIAEKKVCIVSPELHKRNHANLWKMIQQTGLYKNDNLYLCTDFAEEASRFYE
ncbi:MAG: hypothetical protein WDA22_01145 [Bacteroidota bacterium]